MSDTKFTPGPLEVHNTADIFTALGAENAEGIAAPSNDGWHLADCDMGGLSIDEVRGNALLFASANSLYRELETLVAMVERQEDFNDDGDGGQIERCKAALAKAKGEAQ